MSAIALGDAAWERMRGRRSTNHLVMPGRLANPQTKKMTCLSMAFEAQKPHPSMKSLEHEWWREERRREGWWQVSKSIQVFDNGAMCGFHSLEGEMLRAKMY